jgi:nucleoside-specific outer membrane channel protein Tsx
MNKFALAAAALFVAAGSAVAADNLSDPNLSDRPALWHDQAVNTASSRQQFGITAPASSTDAQVSQTRSDGASDYYR